MMDSLDDVDSTGFRSFYLRSTSMLLTAILCIGIGIQFALSHKFSPFGGRSRVINCVYVLAFAVTVMNVHSASSTYQLTRYVGMPTSAMLSLSGPSAPESSSHVFNEKENATSSASWNIFVRAVNRG